MTQPLIQLGPGDAMISGVKPSLDPLSSALWVDGENVAFRKLGVEKGFGWSDVIDIGEDIFEIKQSRVDERDTAYFGAARKVFKYDSSFGLVPIWQFPSAGTVRMETWGVWTLMVNGVDPTKLWKDGAITDIANLPFSWAKILHRKNVHMLAANTTNGESWIEWCAASNIEDWEPTRANSAGNFNVRDSDGAILAVTDLSRGLGIYSSERLVVGAFTGRPFIFNFDVNVLSGIGAVGGRSVVSVGDRNYGMSRQGIFETDGVSYRYVDEPDVQEWLKDTVDFSQGERVVGYHNTLLETVVWHFPTLAGGQAGLPYYYKHRVFGPRLTSNVTAAAERFVFDTPLAVIDGKFVFLNLGMDAGTAALASSITTKPLDAGQPSFRKIYDYLRITGTWTGGRVRLGALENPNDMDSVEWFYDAAMAREHFFERDTPYLVAEFSASGLGETFRISQLLFGGEVTGAEL